MFCRRQRHCTTGFLTSLFEISVWDGIRQPDHEEYIRLHEDQLNALESRDAAAADDAIMRILDIGISAIENIQKGR